MEDNTMEDKKEGMEMPVEGDEAAHTAEANETTDEENPAAEENHEDAPAL